MIEFSRRTGVAVYIIGLDLASADNEIRLRMRRLATETGGEIFFIENAAKLAKIYNSIQEELRSQYLIAYQSSAPGADKDTFREVEIKVQQKGLEAKTIRGYYP